MTSIIFDRFELGLDLRKDKSTADSNRLRRLTNAHVTSGYTIRKRPGMEYMGEAPPDSAGLCSYNGDLVCFTSGSSATVALADGTSLYSDVVPNPDDTSLAVKTLNKADVFDGFIFCSVEYEDGSNKMHYIDKDSSPSGPWHITDSNCPNSADFVILNSVIYAINDETVSSTDTYNPISGGGGPTDWSDASANPIFLPTGNRSPGDPKAVAVGEFNGQLTVLGIDSVQVWFVDPDPTKDALDKVIRNIGTPYAQSVRPVSNDLYFLSAFGFRSVAQQKFTEQYQDVDVGAAIDELVVPHLAANPNARPISIFFGRDGQYWCAVNDKVWCYTYSRTSKVSAWSEYNLPFFVTDFANLGNELYLRTGDSIYKANRDYYLDNEELFTVDILMAYQSFKESGILKHITHCDLALNGTADLQVAYLVDTLEPGVPPIEEETDPIEITGDSRAGPKIPVEVTAEQVAAHVTNRTDEEFELNLIQFYYESLGSM